jgi:catechol 2,3-dioxygenase-like lactoylglutathione lyase family enzyme
MHTTVASIVVMALWLSPFAIAQTKNTASSNKVKSFDHLVINVSDMERALAFYKRLGFTLINEDGWRKGQGQVSIKIGENQKINIHKQDVVGPQNNHISAPRNVAGARGPATSVYFRDPDGNLWEFVVYAQ